MSCIVGWDGMNDMYWMGSWDGLVQTEIDELYGGGNFLLFKCIQPTFHHSF